MYYWFEIVQIDRDFAKLKKMTRLSQYIRLYHDLKKGKKRRTLHMSSTWSNQQSNVSKNGQEMVSSVRDRYVHKLSVISRHVAETWHDNRDLLG